MPDDFPPMGWEIPDADEAALLDAEFRRELPPGHVLDGVAVQVYLAADGIDDVLLRHLDTPDHYTIVHLTYLGRTEINAKFPTVEFDGTWAEFLAREQRLWDELGRIGENKPC